MTFSVKVESNVAKVLSDVEDGIDPTAARAVLKAATFAGGVIATKGMALFQDTKGSLPRSFLPARYVTSEGGIAAGALSDLPHADIQNKGGVIKGKGKKLAIPLTAAAKHKWPRDWGKDLFVAKSKKGNVLLFDKATGTPQYALKDSVTIPGTGYIDEAVPEAQEVATQILDEELQGMINREDKE